MQPGCGVGCFGAESRGQRSGSEDDLNGEVVPVERLLSRVPASGLALRRKRLGYGVWGLIVGSGVSGLWFRV